MFTIEQIATAHARVKSGADFPAYIAELKQLGVVSYETYVEDGHTVFHGEADHSLISPPKYNALEISRHSESSALKLALKAHQQGKTDYPTFCRQAANAGVLKWRVSLEGMTCTYYNTVGNEMVVESIPV